MKLFSYNIVLKLIKHEKILKILIKILFKIFTYIIFWNKKIFLFLFPF